MTDLEALVVAASGQAPGVTDRMSARWIRRNVCLIARMRSRSIILTRASQVNRAPLENFGRRERCGVDFPDESASRLILDCSCSWLPLYLPSLNSVFR